MYPRCTLGHAKHSAGALTEGNSNWMNTFGGIHLFRRSQNAEFSLNLSLVFNSNRAPAECISLFWLPIQFDCAVGLKPHFISMEKVPTLMNAPDSVGNAILSVLKLLKISTDEQVSELIVDQDTVGNSNLIHFETFANVYGENIPWCIRRDFHPNPNWDDFC